MYIFLSIEKLRANALVFASKRLIMNKKFDLCGTQIFTMFCANFLLSSIVA